MYCSGKFLVPMMSGVACDRLSPAVAAATVPPRIIATPSAIAKAALAARRVCLRIMLPSDLVVRTRTA
jgi:hypothetical protein